MNVLVFPCGSEVGLEIFRCLSLCRDIKLFGCSSTKDHGCYVYENYIQIPETMSSPEFLDAIQSIIERHRIDYIFPANDDAVCKLSYFSNVISSKAETCNLIRSKKLTYDFFKDIVKVPNVDTYRFPLFLKPDEGSGSKNCFKAENIEELVFYSKRNLFSMEYLPGREYTVDCFTNFKRELLFVGARERIRTLNGMSVCTKTIIDDDLIKMAHKINETLDFNGAWFFQAKEDKSGEKALLEIGSRIASCSSIQRIRGINLPLLSYFNQMKESVKIIDNKIEAEVDRSSGCIKSRLNVHFDCLFIDFDDCLMIRSKINSSLIKLILETNKKKIILSKHRGDLIQKLKELRIHDLFDAVIHLKQNENKSDYLTSGCLLIDDSFREREAAFNKGFLALSPESFM